MVEDRWTEKRFPLWDSRLRFVLVLILLYYSERSRKFYHATRFRMLSSRVERSSSFTHVGSTILCVRKVSFTTCVQRWCQSFRHYWICIRWFSRIFLPIRVTFLQIDSHLVDKSLWRDYLFQLCRTTGVNHWMQYNMEVLEPEYFGKVDPLRLLSNPSQVRGKTPDHVLSNRSERKSINNAETPDWYFLSHKIRISCILEHVFKMP